MERPILMEHLETARLHVMRGENQIARQKQMIARLHATGADTDSAERVLEAFEQSHNRHLCDMQQILNMLDDKQRPIGK